MSNLGNIYYEDQKHLISCPRRMLHFTQLCGLMFMTQAKDVQEYTVINCLKKQTQKLGFVKVLYGAMSSIQTNGNGDRMEAKPDIHATTYSWLRGLNPTEELGGQGRYLLSLSPSGYNRRDCHIHTPTFISHWLGTASEKIPFQVPECRKTGIC